MLSSYTPQMVLFALFKVLSTKSLYSCAPLMLGGQVTATLLNFYSKSLCVVLPWRQEKIHQFKQLIHRAYLFEHCIHYLASDNLSGLAFMNKNKVVTLEKTEKRPNVTQLHKVYKTETLLSPSVSLLIRYVARCLVNVNM